MRAFVLRAMRSTVRCDCLNAIDRRIVVHRVVVVTARASSRARDDASSRASSRARARVDARRTSTMCRDVDARARSGDAVAGEGVGEGS